MELGFAIFGNPAAGQFPIPRGIDLIEENFDQLTEATNKTAGHKGDPYIHPFENAVFAVNPYYWGDCTCGFSKDFNNWDEENPHTTECYQSQIKGKPDHFIKALCKKLGLTYPDGSGVHCTCPKAQKEAEWLKIHQHKEDCPTIIPNFHHKPSGYKISWYKYPFRTAFGNQEKTPEEMAQIFKECLASIPQTK